jgi:hypothetical protein
MYAAANVGLQDDYETQIVREVWQSSDMSNFTKADFEKDPNMCDRVYEAQGSDGYNKCYNAAIASNTSDHNALVEKYIEAQVKGYTNDFESFKKKTKREGALGTLGNLAEGILGGLLGDNRKNQEGGGSVTVGGNSTYTPPQEKSKIGLYIGLGAVALIGIGTAIYFISRKK